MKHGSLGIVAQPAKEPRPNMIQLTYTRLSKNALVLTAWLCCAMAVTLKGDTLTSAHMVLYRTLEKAAQLEESKARSRYVFTMTTVMEELDAKGKMFSRKERVYEARIQSGWTQMKLLRINGEKLTPAQLRHEEAKDLKTRQNATQSSSALGSDRRENFFTAELVNRYWFVLKGIELVQGRRAYKLTFVPKGLDIPVKSAPDRLLNQMQGVVWIDVEDLEVCQSEFLLTGEVKLWGGFLATLKKLNCKLTRVRIADGIWFNEKFTAYLEGRKLADPFKINALSTSSDFRLIDPAPAVPQEPKALPSGDSNETRNPPPSAAKELQ